MLRNVNKNVDAKNDSILIVNSPDCFRSEQQQANAAACRMLFVLSSVFLVCNLASSTVAYVMWRLSQMEPDSGDSRWIILQILKLVYPLTVFANSTANFPCLILTMAKFRKTLWVVLKIQ